MQWDSLIILISCLGLEVAILARAARGGFFSRLPLFYSYVGCVLCGAIVCTLTFWLLPGLYSTVYWFNMTVLSLAEFAVLMELSGRILFPYPAIQRMGWLLVGGICLVMIVLFVAPAILASRPSDVKFLELMKFTSLAKGLAIAAVLVFARKFRLRLDRPYAGAMLGFAIYFAMSFAFYAAAGEFGRSLFAQILWRLKPLSYALALLIWTVSLWRFEVPSRPRHRDAGVAGHPSLPLREQLRRFNDSLARVLRR